MGAEAGAGALRLGASTRYRITVIRRVWAPTGVLSR